MASTSGKRCTLSIEKKLEILEALKSKKPDEVAKDFNISYSTVKKIRQNEEEIRKIALSNGNLNRKRKRESPNEEIGEAIQEEDFEAFVDCDKDAECFGNLTDAEICDSVKQNREEMVDLEEEEEAGIVDEVMPRVSHKDALMHLSMVRKYLEENYTEYNSYYDIEDMIEKNAFINRTQSKITDFFK
jgi:ribosomal protein L9